MLTLDFDTCQSIEKWKRLLFGSRRWIWQADGSSPIGDSVDDGEIKIDQILMDYGLVGNILFRRYFSFSAPNMYFP